MKAIVISEYQRLTQFYNTFKANVEDVDTLEEVKLLQRRLEALYVEYNIHLQKIEKLVREYDESFLQYRKAVKKSKKNLL